MSKILRRTATTATVLTLTAAGLLASAPMASAGVTNELAWGPGSYTWTVPQNVDTAIITATGAAGGSALGVGGHGGRLRATLAVTPGEVFHLHIGGRGGDGSLAMGGVGGANGGGNGGSPSQGQGAGGGGGASDVRLGGDTLADRVLVAAGGGGGSTRYGGAVPGGDGGGEVGAEGGANPTTSQPAGGGTQTSGGLAGFTLGSGLVKNRPGGFGIGGVGEGFFELAGGGGGAGWYGGGGGSFDGQGGGGGSTYSPYGPQTVVDLGATNAEDGRITIFIGQAEFPVLHPATIPLAQVGEGYSHTFTAAGWPAPSFGFGGGDLPPGMSLTPDGTLAGTPKAWGTYTFTLVAMNNGGATSVAQTLNVDIGVPRLTASGPMSTPVGTPFPQLVKVHITDPAGTPVPDHGVAFSLPTSGPSGTFAGSSAAVTTVNTVTLDSGDAYIQVVAGQRPGTFPLTFSVTDGTGTGQVSGTVMLTATAVPAATPPVLVVAPARISEGSSGTKKLSFTATASRASAAPMSVHWATANGTALSPSDYTAASGTLTLAPGRTSATFSVLVKGDLVREANETFKIVLSTPVGATLATASVVGTIVNDD